MTGSADGGTASAGVRWAQGLGALLSFVGIGIVAVFLVRMFVEQVFGPALFGAGVVVLLAWLVIEVAHAHIRVAVTAAGIMIVVGAATAAGTQGLLIVPAAIGVLRAMADRRLTVWFAVFGAIVSAALIAVTSPAAHVSVLRMLAMLGGIALGLIGGFSRRQSAVAAERSRAAEEAAMRMREEHARSTALEARQAAARDIHDVLAHSLGGLTVQLDAVEALLESGRVREAANRVTQARSLAASGLADARRAVEALRDVPGAGLRDGALAESRDGARGESSVSPLELLRQVSEFVEAHRALGESVDEHHDGVPTPLSEPAATALRRALQEALSNARKHAPGAPVDLRWEWRTDAVELTARNPLVAPPGVDGAAALAGASAAGGVDPRDKLAASGGGQGIPGMRERFALLPGASASAQVEGDEFVVRVSVGTEPGR